MEKIWPPMEKDKYTILNINSEKNGEFLHSHYEKRYDDKFSCEICNFFSKLYSTIGAH